MGKRNTFRYSRNVKKLRQKEKAKLKIKNPIIDSAWQHGMSVKANFSRLGIAHDANKLLKISSRGFIDGSETSIAPIEKKTRVVEALEVAATRKKPRALFMSEDDQLYCMYNLELYGEDLEAMTKDPKNLYQLTTAQLRRLLDRFKNIPRFERYLKEKDAGTFDIRDYYDIPVA